MVMPYGFTEYLESNEFSSETISDYIQVIQQLFSYIDANYKSELEVYEIGTKHLYGFLNNKKESCSVSTVNKIISILKHFFDYLWQNQYIPIDPMSKVKRLKYVDKPIPFVYESLLEAKMNILRDNEFNLKTKALYVLSLKGITLSELKFTKNDVFLMNNGEIFINVIGRSGHHKRTIVLNGVDAEVFYEFFQESLFIPVDYVFSRKIAIDRMKNKEQFKGVEYDVIHHNYIIEKIKRIRTIYPSLQGFTLTAARTSYIIYLYGQKRLSIEQIAYLFGMPKKNISSILENNLLSGSNIP